MSYPYTKPQPRYGFRRDWNNPNTGLVGSGTGRPMRRYVTDAEVGLPQKGAGLGDSQETPVSEGIFNIGPAKGFSRGVFTPDPPWATPRYIASMRDGVNGLGRFRGMGGCCGLGQDADPCGIEKIKNIVVNEITSGLPANLTLTEVLGQKVSLPITSTLKSAIKSILDGLQTPALSALDSAASSGISAIRTALTTHVTPKIVSAAKAALPTQYSSYANLLGSVIDNAMQPLYGKVATQIRLCKGLSPTGTLLTQTEACALYNMVPDTGAGNGVPIVVEGQTHMCQATSAPNAVDMVQAYMTQLPTSIAPVVLTKQQTVDLSQLTTIAAEQAKCASAGGEWYPGGAECDIAANGSLYNCRAPTSVNSKRYYCVPKGTSGATALASSGSLSNTALLLGGAAIVAMLLLGR